MTEQQDLCKSCEHYWTDFPLPLDHVVPHCDILDERPGFVTMDEIVPYPCLMCPFNQYTNKKKKI